MRIGKRSPLGEIRLGLAGGEREIARRERNKAENLDLQIRRGVAGEGRLDKRGVIGGVQLVAHFGAGAGESVRADEGEVLHAGRRQVGVDLTEVDDVLGGVEAVDEIGIRRGRIGRREIGEDVRAAAAEGQLAPVAADEVGLSELPSLPKSSAPELPYSVVEPGLELLIVEPSVETTRFAVGSPAAS